MLIITIIFTQKYMKKCSFIVLLLPIICCTARPTKFWEESLRGRFLESRLASLLPSRPPEHMLAGWLAAFLTELSPAALLTLISSQLQSTTKSPESLAIRDKATL